jgi:hypothetical protein
VETGSTSIVTGTLTTAKKKHKSTSAKQKATSKKEG